MTTYMSPEELAMESGCTIDELIAEAMFDGTCPACCAHGCEVEPDGKCPHGNPSLLIEMGIC